MIRTCDGTDPELVMMIDIDGRATADPAFAVVNEPCACTSMFDDTKHELTWPHAFLPPATPERLIADLPNLMGLL